MTRRMITRTQAFIAWAAMTLDWSLIVLRNSKVVMSCLANIMLAQLRPGQVGFNISLQSDLQLAAELGNTLLERNKDLESTIKHQQGVIEDQIQEIEVGCYVLSGLFLLCSSQKSSSVSKLSMIQST